MQSSQPVHSCRSRVHHVLRADDGVHRAGISAVHATDANRLVDNRDLPLVRRDFNERQDVPAEKFGQALNVVSPPGGHRLMGARPMIASAYGRHPG